MANTNNKCNCRNDLYTGITNVFLCITLNHHLIYFMQYFIYVNLQLQCVKQTLLHQQNPILLCVRESDSSNRSDSSGPMFVEDDSDTDNNLPEIQPCSFDGPSALPPPATPASQAAPTATAEKCKCHENCKDKVFLSKLTFFFCFMSIPFLYFYRLNFFIAFILFIIF